MREEQEFDENRAKGDESYVFRALDLVVDIAQGLAHLNGEPIHFRPRTFQLLEFLIENPTGWLKKTRSSRLFGRPPQYPMQR